MIQTRWDYKAKARKEIWYYKFIMPENKHENK